jgi:hypothetical protein
MRSGSSRTASEPRRKAYRADGRSGDPPPGDRPGRPGHALRAAARRRRQPDGGVRGCRSQRPGRLRRALDADPWRPVDRGPCDRDRGPRARGVDPPLARPRPAGPRGQLLARAAVLGPWDRDRGAHRVPRRDPDPAALRPGGSGQRRLAAGPREGRLRPGRRGRGLVGLARSDRPRGHPPARRVRTAVRPRSASSPRRGRIVAGSAAEVARAALLEGRIAIGTWIRKIEPPPGRSS